MRFNTCNVFGTLRLKYEIDSFYIAPSKNRAQSLNIFPSLFGVKGSLTMSIEPLCINGACHACCNCARSHWLVVLFPSCITTSETRISCTSSSAHRSWMRLVELGGDRWGSRELLLVHVSIFRWFDILWHGLALLYSLTFLHGLTVQPRQV